MLLAIDDIQNELTERVKELEADGKALEAARLKQRTLYDLEMLGEMGYCSGIENYSRHMDRRAEGQTPWTLARLLPRRLPVVRGRIAHQCAAGAWHVQRRP